MKKQGRWLDISSTLSQSKEQINEHITFTHPTKSDGKHMYTLAKDSKVLDVNSPYSYVMWSTYFQQTSMIVTYKDERIGFISGYILPEQPDTLFIWQVAVSEKFRGFGLATRMINALYDSLKSKGIHFIEATVTPSNKPSSNLFKGVANKYNTQCKTTLCFSKADFPIADTEEEYTYRIGPIQ
ncbi:MAG TPA: diaminobutyrate acetyltransferase [Pseudogracilibacillus sp.]|nr:diaminobutyrate acetyltransferase [Pseudogracilibacillus sp.]